MAELNDLQTPRADQPFIPVEQKLRQGAKRHVDGS